MSVLLSGERRLLEGACVEGRRVAEGACRAVLGSLGVVDDRVPGHLGEGDRVLRRGLRAKSRQLGDAAGSIELLMAECGFEQWHRLLFAPSPSMVYDDSGAFVLVIYGGILWPIVLMHQFFGCELNLMSFICFDWFDQILCCNEDIATVTYLWHCAI